MRSYDFTPQVGEPLDRQTVRQQEQGYLASCNCSHCEWTGLFPDHEQAEGALESHVEHERRTGRYHYGFVNWTVMELLDDATAAFCDGDAGLGGGQPHQRQIDDRATWRRSTSDGETVADLVTPGTHIDNNGYGEGVVVSVNERRACGLPVYSVIYVPPGVTRNKDGSYPDGSFKYKNQLVAQDGLVVYQGFDEEPAFWTKGLAEGHQLTFGAVGGQ